MARCLIIAAGCRGLELTRALRERGHAVRATSRNAARAPEIQAAGAEPFIGDPDRVATIWPAFAQVGVTCVLLGSATGTPEALQALHSTRLDMLMEKMIDTTSRGVVYEMTGTVDDAVLAGGAERVRWWCARSLIPYALLDTPTEDHQTWTWGGAEAVAEVREHPRGRPPDELVADDVGLGADRQTASQQTPAGVTGSQIGERQLEHGGDLARAQLPRPAGLDQPHERIDGVASRDRRRGLQRAEHLDRLTREPDLLLGLAQRGREQIVVLGVTAPAGKRDLAGVTAQVVAASGEHGVQVAALEVQRDQHRRLGPSPHVEADRVGGGEQPLAETPRERVPPARHASGLNSRPVGTLGKK
jgi:hypothetical protein